MSNINQTHGLFALDSVQDLDNETAATCSGGGGYMTTDLANADVILYKDANGKGQAIGMNATTGSGADIGLFPDGSDTTFNDTVSSIWVKRGAWDFFQDANYQGDHTGPLLAGTLYNLGHNDDALTTGKRIAA